MLGMLHAGDAPCWGCSLPRGVVQWSRVRLSFLRPWGSLWAPKTTIKHNRKATRVKHSNISASPAPTGSEPLGSVFCLRVPTQTRLWRLLRLFALRAPAFQLVILCFVCFQITTPGTQWIPGACKCRGWGWGCSSWLLGHTQLSSSYFHPAITILKKKKELGIPLNTTWETKEAWKF